MNNASRAREGSNDAFRTFTLSLFAFIIAALALLFSTLLEGGQPWAVLTLLVLVVHAFTDRRLRTLALIVPALGWLVLFGATGNRELFFPFAMYLAAHLSLLLGRRSTWHGLVGGSAVVAAFLVLRSMQRATWPVMAVELGVAAGILGVTLLVAAFSPRNPGAHVLIATAASGLAYFGLSI